MQTAMDINPETVGFKQLKPGTWRRPVGINGTLDAVFTTGGYLLTYSCFTYILAETQRPRDLIGGLEAVIEILNDKGLSAVAKEVHSFMLDILVLELS